MSLGADRRSQVATGEPPIRFAHHAQHKNTIINDYHAFK
jgi:hypothetical protein